MRCFTLIFFILCHVLLFGQNKPAYVLYNSKGKKISYDKMIKTLNENDLILFGEFHDNPISHWLQLEVTKELGQTSELVLGAERMEADNQDELNAYLSGSIDFNQFDSTARLWSNYKTDYAPLVDFAKENNLQFIATNVPRRYARMVHKGGFEALDTLSANEKAWIAPLPIPFDSQLPTYVSIVEMMGDHATPDFVKAQAIKDATMGYFIIKDWDPSKKFIHYNGAFHSDYYEGIGWYVNKYKPDIRISTISTVTQSDVRKLENEHLGKADFIICVDENMTSTH
jgi:uncharacterized iron-regulated protein